MGTLLPALRQRYVDFVAHKEGPRNLKPPAKLEMAVFSRCRVRPRPSKRASVTSRAPSAASRPGRAPESRPIADDHLLEQDEALIQVVEEEIGEQR